MEKSDPESAIIALSGDAHSTSSLCSRKSLALAMFPPAISTPTPMLSLPRRVLGPECVVNTASAAPMSTISSTSTLSMLSDMGIELTTSSLLRCFLREESLTSKSASIESQTADTLFGWSVGVLPAVLDSHGDLKSRSDIRTLPVKLGRIKKKKGGA